jgi:hypothetical protein
MFYYSYDVYMNWYNWYYGIKDDPIVKDAETQDAETQDAETQTDIPPPPSVSWGKMPKKLKKKKNKKRCF